jgi:hypothetical protein
MLSDIYQEFARGVESVGVPARSKHALARDEVDVVVLADAEADPGVHLRQHGALPHGLPGGPLGGSDQVDGDRAATPGD